MNQITIFKMIFSTCYLYLKKKMYSKGRLVVTHVHRDITTDGLADNPRALKFRLGTYWRKKIDA